MQPSQLKGAFVCGKGLTWLGESKCFYMETELHGSARRWLLYVSEKPCMPTYPSPKPTFCPK